MISNSYISYILVGSDNVFIVSTHTQIILLHWLFAVLLQIGSPSGVVCRHAELIRSIYIFRYHVDGPTDIKKDSLLVGVIRKSHKRSHTFEVFHSLNTSTESCSFVLLMSSVIVVLAIPSSDIFVSYLQRCA